MYGVNKTETLWEKQAQRSAAEFLKTGTKLSKKELENYLKRAEFSAEEIKYAVDYYFTEEVDLEELNHAKPNPLSPQKPTSQSPFIPLEELFRSTERNSHPNEIAIIDEFDRLKEQNIHQRDKTQVGKQNTNGTETDKIEASKKETEGMSLFDHPIFAPFVIAVILGNLYVYQKM